MNYMEQVAHMLGVELDEEFCIKGNDNKFKITKYGMCSFINLLVNDNNNLERFKKEISK